MQFKDIYGQQKVKDRLLKMVHEGRVPHALMLHGQPGLQKRELALAFAQYCNCTNRTETDSCGVCPSCRKMQTLEHPDLHFAFPIIKNGDKDTYSDDYIRLWRDMLLHHSPFGIEAWGNTMAEKGVDKIDKSADSVAALKGKVKKVTEPKEAKAEVSNKQALIPASESDAINHALCQKAFEAEYKVMFIWLPEKMHVACANKLLKEIEEPIGKTLFLLVSDAPDSVLETITSRTQMIQVTAEENDVVGYLQHKRPDISVQEIQEAARISKGNLIQTEDFLKARGTNAQFFALFAEMMRASYSRNAKRMRAWSESIHALGRKLQIDYLEYAQRMIRESFISNIKLPELNYMTSAEQAFVVKFGPFVNEKNVLGLMQELQDASRDIEQNALDKIVFFDMSLRITMLLKM